MNDLEEIIRQISNEIRPYGNTRERIGKAFLLLNKAKVDKEQGKGLSTNDFTTELKQKLEDLENNYLQKGTYQGTASDLKHQIENLTIGGRNLLKNTANPQQGNWFFGNCEVSFNQADVFGNNNAIKIRNFRSTDVYFADSSNINDFRKYGAGEYIFSGYFKCNRPTYNLPLHFNHTLIKKQVQITNQWQKISIPFRIQTIGDYAMFHIGGWRTMADFSNLEIDFCYLKIEKGNKPTDWTPAPEDIFIQQATSLLKTSASIRTSQDIGGFSQNGRTIVTQGTANIIVTIDSQDGFVATYQKAGTGNVTFVSTGGKNLILVDRENAIIGDKGSTATITIVENEILLRVHNV